MQGRRVHPNSDDLFPYDGIQPGDYFVWAMNGKWYGMTPNNLLCGLGNHKVTEHENGTITVSPSILVNNGTSGKTWHGFLENGVWREC